MIIKKLPGADPVFMVYDKRDRLVAVQDGNSRANKNGNAADPLWVFTKYDAFNRPVVTGILKVNKTTQADMQSEVETKYAGRTFFVTRTGNGDYSDESYPKISDGISDILTKTYYDDYSFPNVSANSAKNYQESVKGQVTGTATKILNQSTSNFIYTTTYYDDKYRPIQIRRSGFVPEAVGTTEIPGSTETISNTYYFDGRLNTSTQVQIVNGKSTTIVRTPGYDHAGRLTETKLKVGTIQKVISRLTYNKLGQLANKKLQPTTTSEVDNTDYAYNIRGWLKSLNDMNPSGTKHFGMVLYYNDALGVMNNTAQWNGNISAQRWKVKDKEETAYTYSYDNLNRLTSANYGKASAWASPNYDEPLISYDENGNIWKYQRNNKDGVLMDNMEYKYLNEGNQLSYIIDDKNEGYPANSGATPLYDYDNNGNLKKDNTVNKNIGSIEYNVLNLPKLINFGDNRHTSYAYSASGEKLKRWSYKENDNNVNIKEYYAGNMVYNKDIALSYILMDEGRILPIYDANGIITGYSFEYYIKDHLGNTRLVLNESGTATQETHYYPFGLEMAGLGTTGSTNKYTYNGKDKQTEFGLDWLDYGARMYDAAVGRWWTVDPMAEKFYPASPYSYVVNNPIILMDPDGKDWVITKTTDENGKHHYTITLTVAVLNSGKKESTKELIPLFISELKKQTEKLFSVSSNDNAVYDVTCITTVVQINDKSELDKKELKNYSLVEIKPEENKDFDTGRPNTPGYTPNGKELSINEYFVSGMLVSTARQPQNKKTLSHELGHLAGLFHPGTKGTPTDANNFMGWKPKNLRGINYYQTERMYRLYSAGFLNNKRVEPQTIIPTP
jgi:RHS repeat-associated protein